MIASPPDLMRRFVPTPHHTTIMVQGIGLFVASNDNEIVRYLKEVLPAGQSGAEWICKLLRDCENPPRACQDIFFGHHELYVDCHASGTQFVVDRESRELFGFIAADDPAGDVLAGLLRILDRVIALPTEHGGGVMRRSHSVSRVE